MNLLQHLVDCGQITHAARQIAHGRREVAYCYRRHLNICRREGRSSAHSLAANCYITACTDIGGNGGRGAANAHCKSCTSRTCSSSASSACYRASSWQDLRRQFTRGEALASSDTRGDIGHSHGAQDTARTLLCLLRGRHMSCVWSARLLTLREEFGSAAPSGRGGIQPQLGSQDSQRAEPVKAEVHAEMYIV